MNNLLAEESNSSSSEEYTPPQKTPRTRGRGRGTRAWGRRGCGRGKGGGSGNRGGSAGSRAAAVNLNDDNKDYDNPDRGNIEPDFIPVRPPGLHFPYILRETMKRAVDFVRIFLTVELIQEICDHTNPYGWQVIGKKPCYGDKDGAWIETSSAEINKLIACIIYMGLVNASTLHGYWSTKDIVS